MGFNCHCYIYIINEFHHILENEYISFRKTELIQIKQLAHRILVKVKVTILKKSPESVCSG